MAVDLLSMGLFTLAAVVLLGSPGPAIAALVAVGKRDGFTGGLRFYAGLQFGLALAAAISAAGLFSLLTTLPAATTIMTISAVLYLLYLSYKIATAPISEAGKATDDDGLASTILGGFILGMTNPKAYVAFISLMTSYTLIAANPAANSTLKWAICVGIMIVVDIVWLWLGVVIGKAQLAPRAERVLNIAMAAIIVLTTGLALV